MKIGGYEIQVPFVTTSSDSLKTILEFARYKPNTKPRHPEFISGSSKIPDQVRNDKYRHAVDLGSGDGRVALELARHGFTVTGIEHNETLVTRSQERAVSLGLTDHTTFQVSDFWKINLATFDVIYIYGMGSIMGRVEKKLDEEMQSGARFISNVFTLPHWKVKKTNHNVHLYIK